MTWMICIWASTARQPWCANIRRSDARGGSHQKLNSLVNSGIASLSVSAWRRLLSVSLWRPGIGIRLICAPWNDQRLLLIRSRCIQAERFSDIRRHTFDRSKCARHTILRVFSAGCSSACVPGQGSRRPPAQRSVASRTCATPTVAIARSPLGERGTAQHFRARRPGL
jgi:hypothetical protein